MSPLVSTLYGAFALLSQFATGEAANSSVSNGCQESCSQLSSIFGVDFHYPDNDNFTIWDAKQQEVRPACRVVPSTANDVARIIDIVVKNWCRFAVKGGGHSRHPDDSNSVGGVTIDLVKINSIEPAPDGQMARVGGGATTGQVYTALAARNLSFVGGRVSSVGVGGFATGGGTSQFSNKYGWSLDNVIEHEVVLANGTIVTASEHENPDLYFALRGGSNNFGIVTAFSVRTFSQGPVYSASVAYSQNQTETVVDKVYDIYTREDLTKDLNLGLDLFHSYNPSTDLFSTGTTQRYEQPLQDPPVFREINSIVPVSRNVRIDKLANLVSNPPLGVTRNLFQSITVQPSRQFLSRALEIFREEVRAIRTVQGLVTNFILYPLHSNAISKMKERGGNALGINQDGSLFIIMISTGWANAEGDGPVGTMTTNVISRLKDVAVDLGVAHPYIYAGYARSGQADEVFAGYGQENLKRLREIQESVDPHGIFTSQGLWRGHLKLH